MGFGLLELYFIFRYLTFISFYFPNYQFHLPPLKFFSIYPFCNECFYSSILFNINIIINISYLFLISLEYYYLDIWSIWML